MSTGSLINKRLYDGVRISLATHTGGLKGTTRGLSGVFLSLAMNPLCPLKYYDRSIWSKVVGLPWTIYHLFMGRIIQVAL